MAILIVATCALLAIATAGTLGLLLLCFAVADGCSGRYRRLSRAAFLQQLLYDDAIYEMLTPVQQSMLLEELEYLTAESPDQ